jgi:hypothetical protein
MEAAVQRRFYKICQGPGQACNVFVARHMIAEGPEEQRKAQLEAVMAAGSLPVPINSDLHVEPDYGKVPLALFCAHEKRDNLILCRCHSRANLLVYLTCGCGVSVAFGSCSVHSQRAGGRAVIYDRR